LAVRLFVGNLSYATTEADLRAYFGTVAPPSQVVLPVDRETGRPRGFAFVEYPERSQAEEAIQKFNGQVFNGRPLAVSEARAREDRGPGGPRPGGPMGPRPGGFGGPRPSSFGGPRPFDPSAPSPPRNRNFGPDAKPQRGGSAKAKKKDTERPRGPRGDRSPSTTIGIRPKRRCRISTISPRASPRPIRTWTTTSRRRHVRERLARRARSAPDGARS
jgi:RNA recognition motif-containing protein